MQEPHETGKAIDIPVERDARLDVELSQLEGMMAVYDSLRNRRVSRESAKRREYEITERRLIAHIKAVEKRKKRKRGGKK